MSKAPVVAKPPTIANKKKMAPNKPTQPDGYKAGILWGSWRQREPSQEFLTSLAREMIRWVKEDSRAYRIEKFCIERDLHKDTLYGWAKKSDDLHRAIEMAKMVIAERRESGAIERRYDSHAAFKVMAHYDDVYKENAVWTASLGNQDALESTQRIVVIERMPNSDMVPEKKDE